MKLRTVKEFRPSQLVATAAEERLSIWRNLHTSFAAASDWQTIAIYESVQIKSGRNARCSLDFTYTNFFARKRRTHRAGAS